MAASSEPGPDFWTTGRTAGAGVLAGGLAVLGVGLVFHLAASESADESARLREALPPPRESACNDAANTVQCSALRKQVDDQLLQQDLRTGFFIGGGALVLGGAALFLLSSPKEGGSTQGTTRVVPIATGRETGLGVVGRF